MSVRADGNVVSFRDKCYFRLIQEFGLVSLTIFFVGRPGGSKLRHKYLHDILVMTKLSENELESFLDGNQEVVERAIYNAPRKKGGEFRSRKIHPDHPDQMYVNNFLHQFTRNVIAKTANGQTILTIDAVKMKGESVRLSDALTSLFCSETWKIFFENVFSKVSYDLAFGVLGDQGSYSEDDFVPNFMKPEENVVVITEVKEASSPKTVEVVVDPERLERLQCYFRNKVPEAMHSLDTDQQFLFGNWFPRNANISEGTLRNWLNLGESKEIETLLTNAQC